MPPREIVMDFSGCTNVAYRRDGSEWYATALEFDLIGYGRTRKLALTMLQELLSEYLHEIATLMAEGKKVKFFNPSDSDAWNESKYLETYDLRFTFTAPSTSAGRTLKRSRNGIGTLVGFIDSLGESDAVKNMDIALVAQSG